MSAQGYEIATELGQLSAAISGGATSLVLRSGQGAGFSTDFPYDIRIGGDSSAETVTLSAVATDTLTVSATAGAWPEGTAIFMIAALTQPRMNGTIALTSDITGAGGGDVSGPGSSVDRAIPSWNGTTGDTLRSNTAPLISSDGRITTVTDPTGAQDVVTLASMTSAILTTVASRRAVRLVTVAALPSYTRSSNTITATANGALSVDGVAVAVGDRILNRHGTGADRGIYTVTATGSAGAAYVLDRATDADASADFVTGMFVNVTAGSTRVGAVYYLSTTGTITLNTTTLTFDPLVPPRGSAANVQYRDATTGEQEGAARLLIDDSGLPKVGELTGSTVPTTPGSGEGLAIWSRLRAGRSTLMHTDAAGLGQPLHPYFGRPMIYLPQGSTSNSADTVGCSVALLNTAANAGALSASIVGQQRKIRHTSLTTANANCGIRIPASNAGLFYRSTTSGVGGVHAIVRFVMHATRTNQRFLCGFWATLASNLTVDPSTLTDVAAFMLDSGQTSLRWGVNDSGGSADDGIGGSVPADLGSSFPLNTNDSDLYELQIFWTRGSASVIYYSAENITSGAFTEGSSTTNLPTADTVLQFYFAAALGSTTGSAEQVDICSIILYTDY